MIEANADFEHGSNFWVHARYCDQVDIVPNDRVGIIRYDADDTSDPYSPPPIGDHGCANPDPANLVPVVKQTVGDGDASAFQPTEYLKLGQQGFPDPYSPDPDVNYWIIKDIPQVIDWAEPSIEKLTVDTGNSSAFPPQSVPIWLDLPTDSWVSYVLTSNYSLDGEDPPRNLTPSVHPIHLHGHDFAILAQGPGPFSRDEVVPDLDNPARRDVVDVEIGGYIWIAFQVNNPGAWLLHCHINFHSSAGMALQFLEQPSKLNDLMEEAGALDEMRDRCNAWEEYVDGQKQLGT